MNDQESFIYAEQVRLIYGHTITAVIGGPVAALLFVWVFWPVTDHHTLLLWFACIVVFSLIRIFPYLGYKQRKHDKKIRQWGNVYILMSFLQGSLWGAAMLIFIPTHEPIYNVVAAMWIVGVSSATGSAYSAYPRAMLSFFIPLVIPGTLHLFLIGGRLNTALGMAICVNSIVILRSMFPISKSIVKSIKLNFILEKQIEQRKNIEEKLREVSIKDELTGLYNRRYFNEVLQNELKRAQRNSNPISLILIDIDYFKSFNDTYGHVEGDKCLQRLGQSLNDSVKRPGDLVARYGGEELAIVLPNTESDNAYHISETIRQDIQALNIPHTGSDIDGLNAITISAGVTTIIPQPDTTPADIIQKADDALYKAKNQGRNQTVVN